MDEQQKKFQHRLAILGVIALLGFAALATRMFWLQAFQ